MGFRSFFIFLSVLAVTSAFAGKEKQRCAQVVSSEGEVAPLVSPRGEDLFRDKVVETLLRTLPPEVQLDAAQIDAMLALTPRFDMGQIAFPVFTLAKALRKSPVQIAQNLTTTISADLASPLGNVQAVGAYVNFGMDFNRVGNWLVEKIRDRSFFLPPHAQFEKINIEFSQPNTHKALHVGHLRNMVYGEAVSSLLEHAGHKIVRTTYPGDLGAHVAKVLWYIRVKGEPLPESNQVEWLGKMYAEADQFVRSQEGSPAAEQTKSGIEYTLQNIQDRRGPIYALYLMTREWSLAEMRRVYDWLGVRFDEWYFESECDTPSRELVEHYFQQGLFTKSQGTVGIDLAPHGLSYAMLLTSSGNGLYLTKDLELIRRKFSDPNITRSLVVVDDRQKLHFQQVFKIAELMGYPQAKKSVHLAYATVNAEDGAPFSSRTLNGLGIDQVRKNIEEKIAPDIQKRYGGDAQMVSDFAVAVMKYGFLRVDAGVPIRFDLNEWLKLDGDTVLPLINFYAQSRNILATSGKAPAEALEFSSDSERQLVEHLRRFSGVALTAAERYKPSLLTAYLYELGGFYKAFLAENSAEPKASTLALIEATSEVLKEGLARLGIRMPKGL